MANVTVNLPITKSGYVKGSDPYTVFRPSTSEEYRISYTARGYYAMYFGLPSLATSLRHNKLVGLSFTFPLKFGINADSTVQIQACDDFDVNTLTYASRPSLASGSSYTLNYRNYKDGVLHDRTTENSTVGSLIGAYFSHKGIMVAADEVNYQPDDSNRRVSIKTVLANGSSRPYATVTYDDAATVKSKVEYKSGPTSGSISAAASTTFAWDYVKDDASAYCADETWAQTSAVFYWKKSTEGSYHAVQISGSAKSVTIAANTFGTGALIQWYVRGTDEENTTTQTPVYSFSTYATQITPDTYPTEDSVDNRAAIRFTWHFATTGGNYAQRSATLYWRPEGASSWNSIPASGSTQNLTVPAYTFPAGTVIEWYLSGIDASGTASSSEAASFETLPYTLAVSAAPSGTNIGTQSAIQFEWALYNSQGAATQKSAVLYWRRQGETNYTAITNSTSTKSISVPANTFPTASTIQWYLSVTAADNTVKTTNVATFSTVAPKITAQTYPSGNSVDFGSALDFTWIFKTNSGNYGQRSASLFWRAATTDPWSEIPASGSVQRLTVPAYTFPSDSTISWYLQGTDSGGSTSVTSISTFKTVAPKITPQDSPTSGYADPRNAITFAWFFSTGSNNYLQQSADFYWRVAGATSWNHVAASGSTQHVTIAANTFPLQSNIEWYLTGTDIGGTYSETTVYTFSTTASTAYAVCMDPVGKAVDGAKPITLKWIVQNDDGSAATRTIVRWKLPSESQSQWHQLVDTTANITEYTVPANTFPAGPIEWLVIAYNRDSAAGPASQASFVCIVAPDPPSGLAATAVPLTVISWQSTGQEAYEVSIDGAVVKEGFGSDIYSYRAEEPLPDGAHTISVRVQGSYGLWSEASETQIFVENIPKGSLTLTGSFKTDAELFWEFDGEDVPETVAVYRDGKWIGTATGADSFLDRYVLGEHEYRLEYWFADGNYTRSNTVIGTMDCSAVMVAELSGGPWMTLRLSENDSRKQSFTRRRVSALSHVTARKYPILEVSAYEDIVGTFDCAFRDRAEAIAFERLFGKTVILKSRGGTVIMGGLTDAEKTVTRFYTAYSFSVQQIHVEDFVNHDAID